VGLQKRELLRQEGEVVAGGGRGSATNNPSNSGGSRGGDLGNPSKNKVEQRTPGKKMPPPQNDLTGGKVSTAVALLGPTLPGEGYPFRRKIYFTPTEKEKKVWRGANENKVETKNTLRGEKDPWSRKTPTPKRAQCWTSTWGDEKTKMGGRTAFNDHYA